MGHHGTGGTHPCLPTNDAVPPAGPGRTQHRHFCRCLWHHKPHSSSWGGSFGVEDGRDRPTAPTPPDKGYHLRASSQGGLKTLAIVVDAVNDTHQEPGDRTHHVWVVVDAAVDFQIVSKLAWKPLHKGTDSSRNTQALHLWTALRRLPKHVVPHLVKQESHRYSLGNGHIDLHAHNQLAEHMPDGEDPQLQDHMHTHLQHLPPIPHPGEPPAWVPDDRIYNDTGRAYHYPQPIRTMGHIRGSKADNTLMNHLQHKLRTALYFSALDPFLIPVYLQTRRAQLLLEHLPLLDRVAHCYGRRGISVPPEYTICPCQRRGNTSNTAHWPKGATTWPGGRQRTP